MKTTTEEVKGMLLQGRHITKLDLFYESETSSSCLPQRIYDIRKTTDWNIRSRSVKGKGTLREYWLEPEEISRIKRGQSPQQISVDEQLSKPVEKPSEKPQKQPQIEKYEQLGFGLLGGHNY